MDRAEVRRLHLQRVLMADGLRALVRQAGEQAAAKGFHDPPPTFGDRIALIHSEASEALEAFRDGGDGYRIEHGKPEGVAAELADVVIRVADLAYVENIDLAQAVVDKLNYNATRPHRHGGKRI